MAFQRQSLFLIASFLCCLPLCFADDSVLTDLVSRVKALENEGTEQRQILQEQRADLQMLQNVVHQQNTKLLYQTKLIKNYMKRVNILEMKLVVTQKVEPEINEDGHQPEDTVTQAGEKNTKHEMEPVPVYDNEAAEPRKEKIRQTRAADTPVAFQAVFRVGGQTNIGLNQTIVFPDVITNLGGGYQNQKGVFIAPRGGVYIFSTSIGSGWEMFIDVDIRVNGNMLASTMALGNTASNYGQGTVTVVSQLAANDEVCVSLRTPAGTSLQGNYFSSFMGCLVYPLQN